EQVASAQQRRQIAEKEIAHGACRPMQMKQTTVRAVGSRPLCDQLARKLVVEIGASHGARTVAGVSGDRYGASRTSRRSRPWPVACRPTLDRIHADDRARRRGRTHWRVRLDGTVVPQLEAAALDRLVGNHDVEGKPLLLPHDIELELFARLVGAQDTKGVRREVGRAAWRERSG